MTKSEFFEEFPLMNHYYWPYKCDWLDFTAFTYMHYHLGVYKLTLEVPVTLEDGKISSFYLARITDDHLIERARSFACDTLTEAREFLNSQDRYDYS